MTIGSKKGVCIFCTFPFFIDDLRFSGRALSFIIWPQARKRQKNDPFPAILARLDGV